VRPVRHLLITQDYPPMGGGMARRHVELARRLDPGGVTVSTVASDPALAADAVAFDRGEPYEIVRQPFPFRGAKTVFNQARWARWLVPRVDATRRGAADIVHCGNIRPAGYPTWWAHRSTGVPYLVYVYGGDLLRERRKLASAPPERWLKRWTARRIFEDSAGIVAISDWSAALCRDVMAQGGVVRVPPVLVNPLGTNPEQFQPGRDTGALRRRLGLGDAPLLVTVARLVPHKGIDVALAAMATLSGEHPTLRYLVVGDGEDTVRLADRARALGVADRVVFAGTLPDADIAEAYATAQIYVGLSRVDAEINAEGFGIAFTEAAASGIPVVAGDSGGVRSAVRDGETGIVVDPMDAGAAAAAIGQLLREPERRQAIGRAGRRAAVEYFNWERVAQDVREFAAAAVANARPQITSGLPVPLA
jgi:phosphatidylinositol alpha-1,6-mannosyltransferase